MPKLYRLFISSFGVLGIGTVCAFVTHLILAKTLSVNEYGIYNFIISLSLIIGIFSLFGFQNSIVKLIPVFRVENDQSKDVRHLIKFATIFTFTLSVLIGLSVYSILYFSNMAEQYPLSALMIGFLLTPFMVFLRLQSAILRGFNKTVFSIFYETTAREIIFLCLVLSAVFLGIYFSAAIEILLLFFAVIFMLSIVSYLHVRRHISDENKPAADVKKTDKKAWLNLSFPMMLVIFAQRLMRRSDIILIGLILNPAMVGVYAIAAQFSEVSAMSQKVVQSVFSSRAASLYAENKTTNLKQLYIQNLVFSSVATGVLCLCILISFPYVLAFLGAEFDGAFKALFILIIGHFLMVCVGPAAALLSMTGYEKTIMWITFCAAAGNIILNIPMIYLHGIEGAALVTALCMVLRNIVGYIYVHRYGLLRETK